MENKSWLFLAVCCIALSSCGPSYYLRKAERAIQKAEAKGVKWSADTLWKTLEVPVPYVSTDTIFESVPGDTVRIHKDRLKILYVQLPGDSVFIEGECEADTVKVEVPVQVVREIRAGMTTWEAVILCIAIAGMAVVIGMFVQGRRK